MNSFYLHSALFLPKKLSLIKMLNDFILESIRLKTRILLAKDAERLYSIYSDKEAMKYRGSAPMEAIEDAQKMIQNQAITEDAIQKVRLGIVDKSNDKLIGTLLFKFNNEAPNQCEIGYSFDKKEWNKGYGSETIKMTLDKLQQEASMNKVLAWCKKGNNASIRILEKNGFVYEAQTEYPNSCLYVINLR